MIINLSKYGSVEEWTSYVNTEGWHTSQVRGPFVCRSTSLAQQVDRFYDGGGEFIFANEELRELSSSRDQASTTPPPSDPSVSKPISPPTTPNRNPRRAHRKNSAMDRFCFATTFCQLSTKNVADLQTAYRIHGGKLPSRKDIRALSEQIGISQSQIRKWFLENYMTNIVTIPAAMSTSQRIDSNYRDLLERRLEAIERRITVLEFELQKNSSLLQTLMSLPYYWGRDYNF